MRAWVRTTIAIAVLIACTLLPVGAFAAPLRVVILPIVVHSAAENASYVSAGLADMLSARLEQLGEITVERRDEGATTHLEQALETVRGAGADYVVYGAFTQFGDGASLDVHCAPATPAEPEEAAARRRIFIQSGNVSEIIPKLDELVDRVAFFLNRPASAPAPGTLAREAASAEATAGAPELDALRDRVEALEQAVYGLGESAAAESVTPEEAGPES